MCVCVLKFRGWLMNAVNIPSDKQSEDIVMTWGLLSIFQTPRKRNAPTHIERERQTEKQTRFWTGAKHCAAHLSVHVSVEVIYSNLSLCAV